MLYILVPVVCLWFRVPYCVGGNNFGPFQRHNIDCFGGKFLGCFSKLKLAGYFRGTKDKLIFAICAIKGCFNA